MATVELPNKQQMEEGILWQETNRLIHYLSVKMPQETFAQLDANGLLKEKLYYCLKQNFQRIFDLYLETTDNDNVKSNAEGDDAGFFPHHTPKEIGNLLSSLDGTGIAGTGRSNKTKVQETLVSGLEMYTNDILRQKTDVGAFFSGENICLVVKCAFMDNELRPKTVTDVKLCVNIPDSDLINPIFRWYVTIRHLIKDLVSVHIIKAIDKEIESLGVSSAEAPNQDFAGREDIDIGALIERIIERTVRQYSSDFDLANVRENINKNTDIENIRRRGFSEAINTLISILDDSKMSYQFFENSPIGYNLIIREYEDTDTAVLPDERYQITLKYLDNLRLYEDCKVYDAQISEFENEVQRLWDLIEVIYQDSKSVFKVNDFDDLARKNRSRIRQLVKDRTGDHPNEIFVSDISRMRHSNNAYHYEKNMVRACLAKMRERIMNMYEFLYPIERRVMEDRLYSLEKECIRLDCLINPHLLQNGLLIDVDLTSIKRKKTTLNSVAVVLEEFLRHVPADFLDAAMALVSE